MPLSAIEDQHILDEIVGKVEAIDPIGGGLFMVRIDYIKDDHGLADQAYSPFAARCEAIAEKLRATGAPARYVPSLTGDLDALRAQMAAARNAGIDAVMVQPMIIGLSNFAKLSAENPGIAFFAHPTLAGAARIAPQLLFGRIFRMLGADALVFPNHGGR